MRVILLILLIIGSAFATNRFRSTLNADLNRLREDIAEDSAAASNNEGNSDGEFVDRNQIDNSSEEEEATEVENTEQDSASVVADALRYPVNPFSDAPQAIDEDASNDEAQASLNSLCATAGGVCIRNADRDCKAPRAVRRGLCVALAERCCVSPGNGGRVVAPAASNPASGPTVTGAAIRQNWLTTSGGITVIKKDRTSRYSTMANPNPTKFILHTTDGWWPRPGIEGSTSSLDSTRYWPHYIIGKHDDGTIKIYQFLPHNVSPRALKANNVGTIQIEISALSCCAFTDYDTKLTTAVRDLIASVRAVIPGIKGQVISPDWGPATPRRLTVAQWTAASGLGGHMHAPADNHGDPGPVDPQLLLGLKAQPAVKADLAQCLQKSSCPDHIRKYYKTRPAVV